MLYIRADQIRMFRGDTTDIPAVIRNGDSLQFTMHTLHPQDEVYFALTEPNQMWEQAIVKKKYTGENFDNCVHLLHDDTRCLHPGKYYYQLKIKTYDNKVHTLNPKTLLYIQE